MAETTKTYTEREVIERERAAWVAGMERGFNDGGGSPSYGSWPGYVNLGVTARLQYPSPKVERPRVGKDPHDAFVQWYAQKDSVRMHMMVRVRDEVWQFYPRDGEGMLVTPERVAVWSELFANPTEFVDVEDDGSAAASPEGR